jgi:hypothetical protein
VALPIQSYQHTQCACTQCTHNHEKDLLSPLSSNLLCKIVNSGVISRSCSENYFVDSIAMNYDEACVCHLSFSLIPNVMVVAGFAMYNCCDNYSCCYSLIVVFTTIMRLYPHITMSPSLRKSLSWWFRTQLLKASFQ